ncbi:MAG: UDP-N-acetylmuramoyl-L-alanyl-D-glutamate--2,6-diaminopimelate ligase [Bacteroidetes bacterium HGW-Bacteroidetes-21]|jgi:UDP-N-acetylmuramoyl-L-alanyl-D-glutamate--2,6-diaminopimelate ligase|nr:MAG: UDP-N-acetylmuramoyl-L-alanyl-D-glutamate--2,6-diaminopimelate ligase [Bacteroidetes bacterium HGW-Bacteroidetes-21]
MISKTVKELTAELQVVEMVGDPMIKITSICFDSRKVCKGSLFVAVKGTLSDGHHYISTAVDSSVSAIVCEQLPGTFDDRVTYVKVADSAIALAQIASAFYDHPSEGLQIVGVTGTNGKTTIATLLYRLFRYAGFKVGLLSTVRNYVDSKMFESTHTTPDPVQLQKLLYKMRENGCKYCFMEVSSHSIVQKRIDSILFKGGVFTNLTHDHLDYHKTLESYKEAKKAFFDGLLPDAFAITCNDDPSGKDMVKDTKAKVYTYGIHSPSDFKGRIIESHIDSTLININGKEIWSKLIGEFNAKNFLAVYAVAISLGLPEEKVLTLMSELATVDGRFENYTSKTGITAIIDYAHTPDALYNVLTAINSFHEKNRVFTVVGAGGNRDKTKRPEMAKVSASLSNRLILTSDNPRNENPEDILEDMRKGLDDEGQLKTLVISDRKEAIRTAVMMAEKGDIILVAGKGHENYQEIKGIKYHFDDRELIKEFLNIK